MVGVEGWILFDLLGVFLIDGAVDEASLVAAAAHEIDRALSVGLVVFKFAHVYVARGVEIVSKAGAHVLIVAAEITVVACGGGDEHLCAVIHPSVVYEMALIDGAVGGGEHAVAVSFILGKGALVGGAGLTVGKDPGVFALTALFSAGKAALVFVAVGVNEGALSVDAVGKEVALVAVACGIGHLALAASLKTVHLSYIDVALGIDDLVLTVALQAYPSLASVDAGDISLFDAAILVDEAHKGDGFGDVFGGEDVVDLQIAQSAQIEA